MKQLKDQNGTLGDLIADLEHCAECTFANHDKVGMISKLRYLNEVSWRPHHASVEERETYQEKSLSMTEAVSCVNMALKMLKDEI